MGVQRGCCGTSRGELYYEIHGRGEVDAARAGAPLLLIRPLGGQVGVWGSFVDRLSERHTVIVYDHRGSGRSSRARWTDTTVHLASDARRLMQHVGDRLDEDLSSSWDVFGISLGGMVATHLASDPDMPLRRLVLASTPARGFRLTSRSLARGARLAACLVDSVGHVERCLTRRVLSETYRRSHPERVEAIERRVDREAAPRREITKLFLAAMRHDGRDALGEIECPTLVLAGDEDPLVSVSVQQTVCERLADARMRVLDGVGHDLTLEAPEKTAEHVLRFLRAAETCA